MVQHMYLAVAQAHLGSATGATNEWQRALQVANSPEKLLTLATNAEQNSVYRYRRQGLLRSDQDRAEQTGPHTLAGCGLRWQRGTRLKPKRSQQRLLNSGPMTRRPAIRTLTFGCCSALQMMQRKQQSAKPQVLVAKEPRNWQARATLGLACLRLGRNKEALAAIREPRVTGVEPPGALAVRAAILAANGYEEASPKRRAPRQRQPALA